MTAAVVGKVVRENLSTETGTAKVSKVVRENLFTETNSLRVSKVVREALVSNGTIAAAHAAVSAKLVREVLVSSSASPKQYAVTIICG